MYGTFIIETRSAKGGTGRTSLACAIALFSQQYNGQTLLVTDHTGDAAAVLAMPSLNEGHLAEHTSGLQVAQWNWTSKDALRSIYPEARFIVTDMPDPLTGGEVQDDNTTTVTVCPPAYLALRRQTRSGSTRPEHLYTYEMAGAPLTPKDVKSVLQPSEMTLTGSWSADIARAIDAGLFAARFMDGHSIYEPMRRAAASLWGYVMAAEGKSRDYSEAFEGAAR